MQTTIFRSLLSLHLAVMLFGAAGVIGKYISVGALSLVFGRTLFAAVSLAPLVNWHSVKATKNLAGTIGNGALLAVHWLSFFASLQYAAVAFGLMGFATYPIFVALLEPWIFKLPRHRRDAWMAVMVVVGLLVMLSDAHWQGGSVKAVGMGILSGLSFALLTLNTRDQSKSLSATQVAFIQNSVACLLLLPLVLYQGELYTINIKTWFLLALLGSVFTALSHSLFAYSLQRLPATLVSLTASLEPVYGMGLAYIFLGETVSGRTLCGAAIVLLTTSFATYAHRSITNESS
ncbi:DMT family transporter [Undibacterium jejuense]|uniref:DMT family transporter n=1 Tax=Undibacterium jejuense TaxID=1344949 RepID=A0A923KPJ1_9BURK|nr:DMT family transporter [Undibacterium jejuense]MBC3862184.1 DMT family transporter [Undibacterium jejuense]